VTIIGALLPAILGTRWVVTGPLLASTVGVWLVLSTALLARESSGLLASDLVSGVFAVILHRHWDDCFGVDFDDGAV